MKNFLKNMVIKAVKPNVPKTKLQKANRDLKLSVHKTKASGAQLNETIFKIKQLSKKMDNKKKATKAEARKIEKRNEDDKKIFKKGDK
jgi:hypothetical protein